MHTLVFFLFAGSLGNGCCWMLSRLCILTGAAVWVCAEGQLPAPPLEPIIRVGI